MSWLRIDDKFYKHSKLEELSDRAFRLHVYALCLCAEETTDGRITERGLRSILAVLPTRNVMRYVTELVDVRLWSKHDKGWRIKDFLEYNPSSIRVKEQRQRNAERQARYKSAHSVSNGVSNTAPSRTPLNTKNNNHVGPSDVELIDEAAVSNIEAMRQRIGRTM